MADELNPFDLAAIFPAPETLIPAVVQDSGDGAVLMVAYQNREAFDRTVATGLAHFYSRSRKALWQKGETSGHVLHVRDVRLDCDTDTVLLLCQPHGPSCHTGEWSCFYRTYRDGALIDSRAATHDAQVLLALDRIIEQRRSSPPDKSYTSKLLSEGIGKISAKVTEESGELVAAAAGEPDDRVAAEAADVLYHMLVLMHARGLSVTDALRVLSGRFGIGGLDEKRSRNHG